jgi:hypothetical protein
MNILDIMGILNQGNSDTLGIFSSWIFETFLAPCKYSWTVCSRYLNILYFWKNLGILDSWNNLGILDSWHNLGILDSRKNLTSWTHGEILTSWTLGQKSWPTGPLGAVDGGVGPGV